MRIVVVSTPVFPLPVVGYAGLEVIAYHCAVGLAKKGHKVSVIAPSGSVVPGCQVVECGPAGHWNEEAFYGGWKREEGGKVLQQWGGYWPHLLEADCIIDHSWQKNSHLLKMEGRLPNTPILSVMHAPVKTMYNSLPPVEKPCMVCISEDQARQFREIHDPADCRVCHNGADTKHYQPLNIPRSDHFLFLARFSTIKSPDVALKVCKEAGVGLDLVGDTSITNEPDFFEQCRRMADGKQLRIVGSISRGNTVWWYSQSRGFIHLNNRFREPFGLAPVEAQLCETPVLCWDRGAMRETVIHGVTGFLVKSEKEAVDILKSGVMDRLDRKAIREHTLKFSLENMVNRYEQLCIEAREKGGW